MLIKDVDPGDGVVNVVAGVEVESYSFLRGSADSTSGGVYAGPLWLWFTLGDGLDPAHGSTSGVCEGELLLYPCGPAADYDSNPALLSSLTTCTANGCITLPEPGTIGLIFGALGAGWFARRRKKLA
jgi:hypothetical protein